MEKNCAEQTVSQRLSRPQGLPALSQQWCNLLFLHWEVPAEELQKRLPAGLTLDTFGGKSYLGIVPFKMRHVRPWLLPPLPWLSYFLELNVRTYVKGPDGSSGVYFFSLDCERDLAVQIARAAFHLPYQHATMRCTQHGGAFDYTCRRGGQPLGAKLSWKPHGNIHHAEAGSLEEFLVERYAFFTSDTRTGQIIRGDVLHKPYPLQAAGLGVWDATPIGWNGLNVQGAPVHVIASPGVTVSCWSTRNI